MGSLTLMTPGIKRCWMGLAPLVPWFTVPVLFTQWIHSVGRIPTYPCVLCNEHRFFCEFPRNKIPERRGKFPHVLDMMGSGHPPKLIGMK